MNPLIERLEKLRAGGTDNLLLRFGLGQAYVEAGEYGQAVAHLAQATRLDPRHSSSWFWLGRTHYALEQWDEAEQALEQAVTVSVEKGDVQTSKMARVYLNRVGKARAGKG